jgi:hypothetical protein
MMRSSMMPTSTMSLPNGMPEQQIDAIFQEFDPVSLSLDSNLTAMHPQPSGFFAMLRSNLDPPEPTVLDRPDALETAGLGVM